jgi:hypothetical protein
VGDARRAKRPQIPSIVPPRPPLGAMTTAERRKLEARDLFGPPASCHRTTGHPAARRGPSRAPRTACSPAAQERAWRFADLMAAASPVPAARVFPTIVPPRPPLDAMTTPERLGVEACGQRAICRPRHAPSVIPPLGRDIVEAKTRREPDVWDADLRRNERRKGPSVVERRIVQDDIQKGAVHFNAAVLVDETEFAKFIHEETHPRPRGADKTRQRLLADIGNRPHVGAFLPEVDDGADREKTTP